MTVSVEPHDPGWASKFAAEAQRVRHALGGIVREVHHIGSTSVPNICAKPVIDMLVEVTSIDAVDTRNPSMHELGYEVKGEFGISGRRYFRKDNATGVREYQVHVFGAYAPEVARHLAFRDYLRTHPAVAEQYSTLKQTLARKHPEDMDAYIDGKDRFIKDTVQVALAWRSSSNGLT